MYQFSYAEIMEEAPAIARERERAAFDRAIDLLRIADRPDAQQTDRASAAGFLQSLWGVLIEDLSSEDNGLAPDLRADLVSIGLWSMHEANAVIAAPERTLSSLIAVNTAIRDGLR
ncbi:MULTISPECIES: flagellar biosynthesis regulator FlaF [unclassified Methylobacterium]|uniref:flagellar biosynthesis regulator FlaF n=1 Tax=unclassified Methylobacterium TaxID=2615210 RepID=UPI0006FE5EFE|nr:MULTISPECIES: flagellar biosynthesis regulator FlaF [unclassified Methylobacterium]KQP93191.1 flagellar biosynthesis regulator FlaF [Methylobacterium sp. Leaf113]MCK2053224.1 flagellar biosynthesis regulator FlaF [Methylobacterium sp. 37f]